MWGVVCKVQESERQALETKNTTGNNDKKWYDNLFSSVCKQQ